MKDEETTFSHPSYGLVGLSRITGRTRLFGSALPHHENWISLTIRKGERKHSLSKDWFSASKLSPIIEVYLSPAQFADMLTSMNYDFGVPCTIHALHGQHVEDPPKATTEAEEIKMNFNKKLEGVSAFMKEATLEIDRILNKKTLSKADRHDIRNRISGIVREVSLNLPFIQESFQTSAIRIITHAKAEVEAFTSALVTSMGIKALRKAEENDKEEREAKKLREG